MKERRQLNSILDLLDFIAKLKKKVSMAIANLGRCFNCVDNGTG